MKIIGYFRVSTAKQGRSGLGLEAQRTAVEAFAHQRRATVLKTYTEVESGKNNARPQLEKALQHAKVTGATLVIAKLDRLSRNAAFLLTLQDSGAKFIAADMPEADNFVVGIMAMVAQREREATSKRTKEALAAAKARGTRLGNPNGAEALRRARKGNKAALAVIKSRADARAEALRSHVEAWMSEGVSSLSGIAAALNTLGAKTQRGGQWHKSSARNLLGRLGLAVQFGQAGAL